MHTQAHQRRAQHGVIQHPAQNRRIPLLGVVMHPTNCWESSWGRVELVPSLPLSVRVLRLGELLLELPPGDLFLLRIQLLIKLMRLPEHVPKDPIFSSSACRFCRIIRRNRPPHTRIERVHHLGQEDTHHPYWHFSRITPASPRVRQTEQTVIPGR